MNTISNIQKELHTSLVNGRLAHAYMIIGSPRGSGLRLAEQMIKMLFCQTTDAKCVGCQYCRRIDQRIHPDVTWLEPQSKSRKISTDEVCQATKKIYQTAFEGGWKVVVLVHADRLQPQAANALLKTLEEPPDTTVLILVTEVAHALLPTIASRCQKINLLEETQDPPVWREGILGLFRKGWPQSPLENSTYVAQLRSILESQKQALKDEMEAQSDPEEEPKIKDGKLHARYLETRSEILKTFFTWQRDILLGTLGIDQSLHHSEDLEQIRIQSQQATYSKVLERIKRLEELVRRLERNLPETLVFEQAFR